ncbi:hypothetical protein vBVpaMR16F_67 [Vibrio phage vB_VpaM_R16F]|nr:hypothetical protein vBVpaMR16F_67 [Vibrio phage vB_VpaM_R16F]
MESSFEKVKDYMDFEGLDYCHMKDFIMFLDAEMADTDFTLSLINSLMTSLKKEFEDDPSDVEYLKNELKSMVEYEFK